MFKLERAPIVFGRTYEVDFRFLVVPEDFQVPHQVDFQLRNQDWLESHINTTMLLAEQLPGRPRWSIFKNHTHGIAGLTCMASDVSNEKTHDREGRALYVFLGYVFRSVEIQPIPMRPEEFRSLYARYILTAWDEKAYSTRSKLPELAAYQNFEMPPEPENPANLELIKELNSDETKIFLWSNTPEFREKLWHSAAKCLQPMSVCLGLPTEASALRGVFTNGTTLDFPTVKVLDREQRSQQKIVLNRSNNVSLKAQWNEANEVLYGPSDQSRMSRNKRFPPNQGTKKTRTQDAAQHSSNLMGELVEGVKGFLKAFDPDPEIQTKTLQKMIEALSHNLIPILGL
jgi:hypothetical protein